MPKYTLLRDVLQRQDIAVFKVDSELIEDGAVVFSGTGIGRRGSGWGQRRITITLVETEAPAHPDVLKRMGERTPEELDADVIEPWIIGPEEEQ